MTYCTYQPCQRWRPDEFKKKKMNFPFPGPLGSSFHEFRPPSPHAICLLFLRRSGWQTSRIPVPCLFENPFLSYRPIVQQPSLLGKLVISQTLGRCDLTAGCLALAPRGEMGKGDGNGNGQNISQLGATHSSHCNKMDPHHHHRHRHGCIGTGA